MMHQDSEMATSPWSPQMSDRASGSKEVWELSCKIELMKTDRTSEMLMLTFWCLNLAAAHGTHWFKYMSEPVIETCTCHGRAKLSISLPSLKCCPFCFVLTNKMLGRNQKIVLRRPTYRRAFTLLCQRAVKLYAAPISYPLFYKKYTKLALH